MASPTVSSTKPNASSPDMSVSPRSEKSRSRTDISLCLFHFIDELLSGAQHSRPHDCEDSCRDDHDAHSEDNPCDNFAALIACDSSSSEAEPDSCEGAHFFLLSRIRWFGRASEGSQKKPIERRRRLAAPAAGASLGGRGLLRVLDNGSARRASLVLGRAGTRRKGSPWRLVVR